MIHKQCLTTIYRFPLSVNAQYHYFLQLENRDSVGSNMIFHVLYFAMLILQLHNDICHFCEKQRLSNASLSIKMTVSLATKSKVHQIYL